MKDLGYYNGKIDRIENIMIPMQDRVCFFGDGVYDVTYARNHIPYCLEAHLDRFYRSARELRIAIPMDRAALGQLLQDLVNQVDSPDQMMYWQVTRGTASREHAFPKDTPANLWVMLRPKGVMPLDTTLTLHSVEDTRFLHCNVKTLNLIPNVMAEQEAREAGADTALFHRGERVTECAHANIHIIRGGFFVTPPADKLILPGIARQNLLRICEKLDIPVAIRPFTMAELMEADEVISSSSGEFCLRVTAVDGKPVGGKDEKTLRKLQEALMEDFLAATGGSYRRPMNGFQIVTERLVLTPLGTAFLDSVNEYALDYENTRYMCHLPNRDSDETLSFLKDVEAEWQKDSPDFYEFALLYGNRHIGSVSVYFENGVGELGWIVNRKYWGNGFAAEAAKGLVDYFSKRGRRRFIAHCDTENTASFKVMEKLGMTRTGRSGGRKNRAAAEESFEYQYELEV